jgi:glutaconate CoA-transferase subunit A
MAEITSLQSAVAGFIHDGDTVAMEGFTHLIPHAAGHEVIRQEKTDLTLIRMTPDVIYDQLIGAGCAQKLVFSWGGNPGVGSLNRLRDAVENEWPRPLEIEEHSHAAMTAAYEAGASDLPFGSFRGYVSTDQPRYNDRIRSVTCPFTGEELTAVPAHEPDVTVIHAQRASRAGAVQCWGITGVQKEAALAADRVLATVEEVVDELTPKAEAVVLPDWTVNAVCEVPKGAHPSYAQDYYDRDNAFYLAWDDISRDRKRFLDWLDRHVHSTANFSEFRDRLTETEEPQYA